MCDEKINPDFWEVTLSHESWRHFSTEDHPYYEAPEDAEARQVREDWAKALMPELRAILDEVLTPRQREAVILYFFEKLNQREIARKLGISQQSVSEHLYGKVRNGRAVGGALRKLDQGRAVVLGAGAGKTGRGMLHGASCVLETPQMQGLRIRGQEKRRPGARCTAAYPGSDRRAGPTGTSPRPPDRPPLTVKPCIAVFYSY